jgi:hypothetical protein
MAFSVYDVKKVIDHARLNLVLPLTQGYVEGKKLEAEALIRAAEIEAEARHHEAEARITAAQLLAP